MRQIFSIRFLAALGAIVGLLAILVVIRNSDSAATSLANTASAKTVERHRIDFVDHVFAVENTSFAMNPDGTAASDTNVIIDGQRYLKVVAGTPGEIDCPDYTQVGKCAIVADLLGEAVVWFALVPHEAGQGVNLPAIDVLEGDRAVLVNGWEFAYAPVLDRRCPNREWDSYRAFRADLGDHFTSVYDIAEQRIVAVVCDVTVPWVTTTTSLPSSSTTTTTTVAAAPITTVTQTGTTLPSG